MVCVWRAGTCGWHADLVLGPMREGDIWFWRRCRPRRWRRRELRGRRPGLWRRHGRRGRYGIDQWRRRRRPDAIPAAASAPAAGLASADVSAADDAAAALATANDPAGADAA